MKTRSALSMIAVLSITATGPAGAGEAVDAGADARPGAKSVPGFLRSNSFGSNSLIGNEISVSDVVATNNNQDGSLFRSDA